MTMRLALSVLVMAVLFPVSIGAAPRGTPVFSEWIDARHGWAYGDGTVHATADGGRTWRLVFRGSNYTFSPTVRTSRGAGLVSTGKQAGGTFWTNDGGRRWYDTGVAPLRAVAAGRGNLLFWHVWGGELHRVEGWPPRGDFACRRLNSEWGPPAPGHPLCAAPPNDADMRSVVVARLDRRTFGLMRPVPGGAFAAVLGPNGELEPTDGRRVALYRNGDFSVTRLPNAPPDADQPGMPDIAAAWPRLYATSGSALWRSGDGGMTWSVMTLGMPPKRLALVRGRTRIGPRTWLPGGFFATARIGRQRVVMIRQLRRTRLLALPGAAGCTALEPRVDWPQLFVEGRRAGRTVAVWHSAAGGGLWTRFGRC